MKCTHNNSNDKNSVFLPKQKKKIKEKSGIKTNRQLKEKKENLVCLNLKLLFHDLEIKKQCLENKKMFP